MDNFLKKQIRESSPSRLINSNESAVKYFKAMDKVKYYSKVNSKDHGSETDVLLSGDDDEHLEGHTLVMDCGEDKRSSLANGNAHEQYRLLSTSSA